MSNKNFPHIPLPRLFTFFYSPAAKSKLLLKCKNKSEQYHSRGDQSPSEYCNKAQMDTKLNLLPVQHMHNVQQLKKRCEFTWLHTKHSRYISYFQLCLCQ